MISVSFDILSSHAICFVLFLLVFFCPGLDSKKHDHLNSLSSLSQMHLHVNIVLLRPDGPKLIMYF